MISRRDFLRTGSATLGSLVLPIDAKVLGDRISPMSSAEIFSKIKVQDFLKNSPLYILGTGTTYENAVKIRDQAQKDFISSIEHIPFHLWKYVNFDKSNCKLPDVFRYDESERNNGMRMNIYFNVPDIDAVIQVNLGDIDSDTNIGVHSGKEIISLSRNFQDSIDILNRPIQEIRAEVLCGRKIENRLRKEKDIRREQEKFNKKYTKFLNSTAFSPVSLYTSEVRNIIDDVYSAPQPMKIGIK